MANEAEQMTVVARERADKRIDQALGELKQAAQDIGKKYDFPDGIAGHSIAELLGRMAYVPTISRDLRRACGQELAKVELNSLFEERPASNEAPKPDVPTAKPVDVSKIPDNIPVGLDVGSLDGISVQTVNALRDAGLTKVGDIVAVPDEHLVKMQGLGEKSVAHVRAAIAKASK